MTLYAARIRLVVSLLFVIIAACRVAAQPAPAPHPRLILVVTEGIALRDLDLKGTRFPQLRFMAEHGTLGLMNCATVAPATETDSLLAIAASQLVPSEPSDEQAANDWEKAPGEVISALESHRVRLLPLALPTYAIDPGHSVKHLGIKRLQARGLDSNRLGSLLAVASPPVSTWIVGNADTAGWRRRAALLTVDRLGVGSGLVALRSYDPRLPFGLSDRPHALAEYAFQTSAEFIVIQLGDGARSESARTHLSAAEYQEAHDHATRGLDELASLIRTRMRTGVDSLLIVSTRPVAADPKHNERPSDLTPVLGYGPAFPPGTIASATTRTLSLISNIDITPTILSHFHLAVPPTMIGRPFSVIPDAKGDTGGEKRIKRIVRLEFLAWANNAALAPVLAVLGGFCFIVCMVGLMFLRSGARAVARVLASGMVAAMNFPAAQMFAPLISPPNLQQYALTIGLCMAALTLVTYAVARMLRLSVPVVACGLNITIVLIDLVSGQHLLKDALISNYSLPGFRF